MTRTACLDAVAPAPVNSNHAAIVGALIVFMLRFNVSLSLFCLAATWLFMLFIRQWHRHRQFPRHSAILGALNVQVSFFMSSRFGSLADGFGTIG